MDEDNKQQQQQQNWEKKRKEKNVPYDDKPMALFYIQLLRWILETNTNVKYKLLLFPSIPTFTDFSQFACRFKPWAPLVYQTK